MIKQSELGCIQENVSQYCKLIRKFYPSKITPKIHMLENHCVPFIETFGFGLGLLGEQGGELIHATIAKIEKRTQGIRKRSKQLKSTVEAHRLQNSSALRSLFPEVKKRAKKM